MIDESAIIPFAASGIGFFCLIGVCLGCRRMIISRQIEKERQQQQQLQTQAVVHVPIEGEYVGGFTVSGYPQPIQKVVYPNTGTYGNYPIYGIYGTNMVYGNGMPQPSAPVGPPGNYLTTSVTV